MEIVEITDKERIEAFLRSDTPLHIYELGDLDDTFFHDTRWFAGMYDESILALALLYTGLSTPTLIAIDHEIESLKNLLIHARKLLPGSFYAHLSQGLESVFRTKYSLENHGKHYKMILTGNDQMKQIDFSDTLTLTRDDLPDIIELYEASYPDSWFDQNEFEKGVYVGCRNSGQLVSIAATHVYSEEYKVAAIGNITTHQQYRNMGFAAKVVAGICHRLQQKVDYIGLNVASKNKPAMQLYRKLGFSIVGSYNEVMISN